MPWRGLLFRFIEWLSQRHDLRYVNITIKIGGEGEGPTDIIVDQHYKAGDVEIMKITFDDLKEFFNELEVRGDAPKEKT